MNYFGNAGSYIIDTVFGLALYLVLLRYWMQWVHANFRNPIGQFVIAVSNPIVIPLRRLLPSIGSIDTATLALAFIIAIIKTLLWFTLANYSAPWLSMLAYSLGEVIEASIYLFMAAIFFQIIASWINPHSHHPVLEIAHSIAEPLMAPARRLIPPIAGLDISPILVFMFLNLSLMLVVSPLQHV